MKLNKSITIFFLLICLGISVYAQTNSEQNTNQCRYGETDFVGENTSLGVTDVDIREVLTYITQQFGCDFVVDDSIKEIPITTNLTNVPWNLALDAILQSQGYYIKVNKSSTKGSILQVYEHDLSQCRSETEPRKVIGGGLNKTPIYTEVIKLNNVPENKAQYFENLIKLLKMRLSRKGVIEIYDRSNILILTDVRENLETLKQLITLMELLDSEKIEK